MSWMPWNGKRADDILWGKSTAGRYARKLLHYAYFDRQERGILLMRQDITTEYLEQRRQKKRLSDALFMQGLILLQACITARQ